MPNNRVTVREVLDALDKLEEWIEDSRNFLADRQAGQVLNSSDLDQLAGGKAPPPLIGRGCQPAARILKEDPESAA